MTGRGAVAALNVVGVYKQAWFAIHLGLSGEQQVLVRLVGTNFLSVFTDQNLSTEYGFGFAIQDALVEESAGPVGFGMVYVYEVIYVLGSRGHIKTVQVAAATRPV